VVVGIGFVVVRQCWWCSLVVLVIIAGVGVTIGALMSSKVVVV